MKRYVLLYRDEDGAWIVEVPSLPGCGSDGETREEALVNVKEAIQAYVEALEDSGRPVPEDFVEPELAIVDVEMIGVE